MKTYSAKPTDVSRQWYVLDASQVPLGRLATVAAQLLLGKGKPQFTQHIDCGDYVVVTNAQNLVVTGNKAKRKVYYKHSNYPGGLRERRLEEQLERDASKIIEHAIRGMLPVNKLRPGRLARLKIYNGAEHEHGAQKPTEINLKEGR